MTLTFLLTDIEGSTRLWETHRQAMEEALARHDRLVSQVVADHGGRLVKAKGEGDSSFSVFTSPAQAVAAALELQRALAAEPWPLPAPLAVRVAVHAGEVQERGADFYGPVVNRCARLRAIGHGGQVLLSAVLAELVQENLPQGAYLRDLGVHRLKDLAAPERVFQLSHPELRAEFPPLNSLEARPNNLPLQLTSFIGRDSQLAGLRQQLVAHRLVTLTGIGGCGKTRLALQASADALDAYSDGVWLVELAPLSEPSLVERQLATVLGIREVTATEGRTLTDRLVDHLASRRTLVLLDNCEHLVAACAGLAAGLVSACPDLTVLATSREPLGVAGEVTFGVLPLAVDSLDPADIGSIEAVRLFVDRARLANPNFGLTTVNASAVASICRRLDGIPLAIELAAARTRSLTAQQLDARLGDRFRLLAGGPRTSLPRHQTLRAAIDWSHRLLSGPEQVLFRRLAVFAGGFTLEAAEQVCANDDDDLDVLLLVVALVDRSLLVHEAAQGRYRMLETIRQFAWDKLVEASEDQALRARHRDWCLALAEAAEFTTPAATAWLARLAAEQDNFRAALEWDGPTGDDGAKRLRLGGALREFWWAQAQPGEGRHWLERALRAAPDASAAARARALLGVGLLAGEQGDAASATAYFRQSQALYEQLGNRRGVAEALVGLGETAVVQGRYEQARPLLEQAVREARAAGSQHLAALALNFVGNGLYLQGDWTGARPVFEQALEGFRSVGNPHGVAVLTVQIGLCALEGGDQHEARSLVREGLELARQLDFRWGELYGLDGAALLAARMGSWEVAATLLGATEGPREASPAPQLGVREAGIADLTAALDPDSLSALWDKGRAMPLDQAIDYALQHL
jgi:predicted ATPase/class 3 adenylate cyclase